MNATSTRRVSVGLIAVLSAAGGSALTLWATATSKAGSAAPVFHTRLEPDDLRHLEGAVARAATRAVRESAPGVLASRVPSRSECPESFDPGAEDEPTDELAPADRKREQAVVVEGPSEQALWTAKQRSERVIAQALARGSFTSEDSEVMRETTRVLSAEQQQAYFAQLMNAATQGRLSINTRGPLF